MNKYELKITLASELTIEQVEDLFTELINDKIGSMISGSGEVLPTTKFETIYNNKCTQVTETGRPRCMFLDGDICKSIGGCCFK